MPVVAGAVASRVAASGVARIAGKVLIRRAIAKRVLGLGRDLSDHTKEALQDTKVDVTRGVKQFAEGMKVEMVEGDHASTALVNIQARLANRHEPHDEAGQFLVQRIIQSMGKEETAEGSKWPKLAKATIENRKRGRWRSNKPILEQSTALKRSVKHEVLGVSPTFDIPVIGRRGFGRIKFGSLTKDTVTRVSPAKFRQRASGKARAHQGRGLGTVMMTGKGHKTPTPSRPYIGITNSDTRKIERIFESYVRQSVRLSIARSR